MKKDGYKYLTACIAFAIVGTDTGVVSHFEGVQMVDFQRYREISLQEMLKTGGGAAGGLTVRDYFAAAALQGMMASAGTNDEHVDRLVKSAFIKADAMMRERNRPFEQQTPSVEEAFGLDK